MPRKKEKEEEVTQTGKDGTCFVPEVSIMSYIQNAMSNPSREDYEEMMQEQELYELENHLHSIGAPKSHVIVHTAKFVCPESLEQKFTVPISVPAWVTVKFLTENCGVNKGRLLSALIDESLPEFIESLPELLRMSKVSVQKALYESTRDYIEGKETLDNGEGK